MEKRIDPKPWGEEYIYTFNEPSTVKILVVKAGERFSLQYHKVRKEIWRVVEGSGKVVLGDETLDVKVGDEFLVKPGQKHRIQGGKNGIKVLEVALGEFDPGDNVRLEDDYGRTSPGKEE